MGTSKSHLIFPWMGPGVVVQLWAKGLREERAKEKAVAISPYSKITAA
jgi:hypothetical protein